MVVDDALRQAGRARRVDHRSSGWSGFTSTPGASRLPPPASLATARDEVGRVVRRPALAGAQHEHVLRREVRQAVAAPSRPRPEPLVDDEDAGARLVQHAGERVAAQAGVDAEERDGRRSRSRRRARAARGDSRAASRRGPDARRRSAPRRRRRKCAVATPTRPGTGGTSSCGRPGTGRACSATSGCGARASIWAPSTGWDTRPFNSPVTRFLACEAGVGPPADPAG